MIRSANSRRTFTRIPSLTFRTMCQVIIFGEEERRRERGKGKIAYAETNFWKINSKLMQRWAVQSGNFSAARCFSSRSLWSLMIIMIQLDLIKLSISNPQHMIFWRCQSGIRWRTDIRNPLYRCYYYLTCVLKRSMDTTAPWRPQERF